MAADGPDGHDVSIPSKFQVEAKDDAETEDDEVAHDTEDDGTDTEEDDSATNLAPQGRSWSATAYGIWTKVGAWCPSRGPASPSSMTSSPLADVIEICATEAEDSGAAGIVQVNPDITVDSGAGASVANQPTSLTAWWSRHRDPREARRSLGQVSWPKPPTSKKRGGPKVKSQIL